MKISDHLSDNTKKKMHDKAKKKKCEIDPEELEERQFKEMESLMGKHMDIYERRGGKVRRK